MKQYCFLLIFAILFFHTGCTGKKSTAKQSTETDIQTVPETEQSIESDTQTFSDNDAEEKPEYVFIGGKRYKGGWGIEGVYLWVDPEDPESSNSLENIELFWNLKKLTIRGKNLDKVDFSPISLLTKLEELEIEGNITRMPDMTNLKQLREVEIKGAALKSLEGINGPSIEKLLIESPKSNSNTVLKVSDMKNMNELKSFKFRYGKIDAGGIDRFSSLDFIELYWCEPYNFNSIGNIKIIKAVLINLISANPSIEFLNNMPNLYLAHFYGNRRMDYSYNSDEYDPIKVLDVKPLAASKKLQDISFEKLIIKNISALDTLEHPDLGYIALYGSKLYYEKEKSRHALLFETGDR